MGKRKKAQRGPAKKVKQTLSTTFSCLFCNHENSVVATMDKKVGVGNLSCKVCGQTFQASINALSDPIDVYSEWVDACEAVAASDQKGDKVSGLEKDRGEDTTNKDDDDERELSDLDEDEFS